MPPCLCARNASEDDLLCGGLCYRPWVSFSLAIILGSCGYYARDALSGLSTEVIADFGLNRSEYGLASTVVSIPTVFLAFAFGSLLDTFGVRRCTVVYTLILAFGGIAVAMSTIWRSFALLNVGRVAVGLGALRAIVRMFLRSIR